MNNKITKLRKHLNLSRVKFSQAIGVSNTQMRRIEIGEVIPGEQLIRKICSTYHVDPRYFAGSVDLDDAVRVVDQEEKKREVGKRLREARLESGMTLKELSALIGLSDSQLCLIENGEYKLTEKRAKQIGEVLCIGVEWLLYGDEKNKDFPVDGNEYYGAAEPPVRSIQSQCSGGMEPL